MGKRMQLGNASLTRLWNQGGNSLEAIAQKQQSAIPGLQEYLKPIHEQMDPAAGIEEQYACTQEKATLYHLFLLIVAFSLAQV